MEDERIIALLFQRSEEALRCLADKYGRVCHSMSYRILGDRRDAEECVNDAYLGVWNSVPPQRPDPLAAYLCRIVRNLSIKRYHANRAAKRHSGYDLALEELAARAKGERHEVQSKRERHITMVRFNILVIQIPPVEMYFGYFVVLKQMICILDGTGIIALDVNLEEKWRNCKNNIGR